MALNEWEGEAPSEPLFQREEGEAPSEPDQKGPCH